MLKKLSLAGAALAMSATALVSAAPAQAQRYDRYNSYQTYQNRDYDRGYNDNRGYNDYQYDRGYRDNGRRYYSNRSYRQHDKCRDGDGGTIVGAIAGGLLGRTIAGRGDHVLGTIIGGLGGAVAGRAIDRSDRPDYCRR